MASLNWGIVGPGKIAHDFAYDLALVKPQQRISAVLGIVAGPTNDFVQEFSGGNAYTDLSAFIKKAPDIVYIATPHPQHYEVAIACLQAKIPVLCEKPLALNMEQTHDLVNASRKYQSFLMEGMWIRFLPGIQKAKSLVGEGAIGKVVSVKASMGFKAPQQPDSRYFDPALGGGSLLDLGIYPVFLTHFFLGKPSSIKAIARLSDRGIDESCSMLFDYDGYAHAILDSSLVSQSDRPAEIAGEKGIIRIQHPWFEKSAGIELELYNQDKEIYPTEWDGHGLQFEIDEVIQCLEKGKIESDLLPHAFSVEISETLDEIRNQINVVYKEYE